MNGHVFYTETMTDFQAEVELRMNPNSKFDRAEVSLLYDFGKVLAENFIRIYSRWSISFRTVVTNNGYSDWSTQDFPTELANEQLRFRLFVNVVIIQYM